MPIVHRYIITDVQYKIILSAVNHNTRMTKTGHEDDKTLPGFRENLFNE